jgi:hypothetical protein
LVVSDVCFGAVCEKWQSQRINGKMALDAIGAFIVTKSFRLSPGMVRILHRKGSR